MAEALVDGIGSNNYAHVDTNHRLYTNTVIGGRANLDAFGRLRVSQPTTLFDSKQTQSNLPLFWDDQETSGTGTTNYLQIDSINGVGPSSLPDLYNKLSALIE